MIFDSLYLKNEEEGIEFVQAGQKSRTALLNGWINQLIPGIVHAIWQRIEH